MDYLLLIFLTLIFVLIVNIFSNQHFFYHITTLPIRFFIWNKMVVKDKEKNDNMTKKMNKLGFQRVVDEIKDNYYKFDTPFFSTSILVKYYDENYSNPNYYSKKNSLPSLLNIITTPTNLLGQWSGDSIFRMDYYDRGENNKYKEYYLKALEKDKMIIYKDKIVNYLNNNINKSKKRQSLFNFIKRINIDLTYLLHFDILPNEDDIKDINIFIDALATAYTDNKEVIKQIENLQYFYKKSMKYIKQSKNKNCICGYWLEDGKNNIENIFIEFIHNIVGMTINWINLTYKYLIDIDKKSIPKFSKFVRESDNQEKIDNIKKKYIFECFRYITPATFVGSNKYDVLYFYDLKSINKNKKLWGVNSNKFDLNHHNDYKNHLSGNDKISSCPFMTSKKGAKVGCGFNVYEKKGYIPFGEGYRRCPGEHISMLFMECLIDLVEKLDFSIENYNNTKKLENFIWDKVDKNLLIKF